MAKFKVGDKVKHIGHWGNWPDTETICKIDSYWYYVGGGSCFSLKDENLFEKVKEKKPWKKATPKRIAKLEVGDIVLLRNGNEAKIINIHKSSSYPVEHDKGINGYMACKSDGTNCLDWYEAKEFDIVKIKNKKYVA